MQPGAFDPDTIDPDAIGASQVAHQAERRIDFNEEVMTREEGIFGHRALGVGCSTHRKCRMSIKTERLPFVRPGGNTQIHFHQGQDSDAGLIDKLLDCPVFACQWQ